MGKNLFGIIVSYIYIFLVIAFAKLIEKRGKEESRKFIHILLSNWWFIAILFFDNPVFAAFVPFSFVIINWLSCKKNIIKVMERDSKSNEGFGTVYYAISLLIISIITFGPLNDKYLGLIGILIMGYGDGLAAVIGKRIKSKEFKIGESTKTLAGSLTMMAISFVIISSYLIFKGVNLSVIKAIILSVIVTLIEAISVKGTDNLTVPLLTCMMLKLMI